MFSKYVFGYLDNNVCTSPGVLVEAKTDKPLVWFLHEEFIPITRYSTANFSAVIGD